MALIRLWHICKDTTLALWEITETTKELQKILLPYCVDLPTFKSEKRLKEWLATRCLSVWLFETPFIAYNPEGKPYLLHQNTAISISHSQNFVAIAFSKTHFIGTDIQYFTVKTINILKKFTNDKEKAMINFSEHKAHLVWIAKEAMYKLSFKKPDNYAQQLQVNAIFSNYLNCSIYNKSYTIDYLILGNLYLCVVVSKDKII